MAWSLVFNQSYTNMENVVMWLVDTVNYSMAVDCIFLLFQVGMTQNCYQTEVKYYCTEGVRSGSVVVNTLS